MLTSYRSVFVMRKDGQESMWFSHTLRRWIPESEYAKTPGALGTHHDGTGAPKTHRAFKRYLRKHPELKGCEVWHVSRYKGHDVCFDDWGSV